MRLVLLTKRRVAVSAGMEGVILGWLVTVDEA
jgi:hypothetical protein